MIKRRYNAATGKLGKAYPDHYIVPEPFLTLSNEENDRISTDTENIYYYVGGAFKTKCRAEVEAKEKSREFLCLKMRQQYHVNGKCQGRSQGE